MRANRKAVEATVWALGAFADEWPTSPLLRDGWGFDAEGALLLESQRGGFERLSDMDLTGYEATHNHLHLDPVAGGQRLADRVALWPRAVGLLVAGLRSATRATGGRRVLGTASLGVGQGATVRWHLDRGVSRLADDLEGFANEAVLVLTSDDLELRASRSRRRASTPEP